MKQLFCKGWLVFFCLAVFGQQKTIHGAIRDAETQLPIPFANIGIKNKSVGTVADANGFFLLKLDQPADATDSITVSHIGFKTKTLVCNPTDKQIQMITLNPEPSELKEVVVQFVKPKPKRIGRDKKGLGLMHMNFYTAYEKEVDDRLGKEVGMRFKVKKDCHLQDFNFNITSNDFKSLKFRLNCYKVENGVPTTIIIAKDIIFEINNGFLGWYRLDLKPYGIYLDREIEDIVVTIQWIESTKTNDKSKYFGIATAMSASERSFYREKAMDTWKQTDQSLSFYLNALCK